MPVNQEFYASKKLSLKWRHLELHKCIKKYQKLKNTCTTKNTFYYVEENNTLEITRMNKCADKYKGLNSWNTLKNKHNTVLLGL